MVLLEIFSHHYEGTRANKRNAKQNQIDSDKSPTVTVTQKGRKVVCSLKIATWCA